MMPTSAAQTPRSRPVIRISLPFVYRLATELEPIPTLQSGEKIFERLYVLFSAKIILETLLNASVYSLSLRSCRESANTLLTAINGYIESTDPDRTFQQYEIAVLRVQFEQFKTALLAEVGIWPAYFVTQKESFDTLILLDAGFRLFPSNLMEKVPEAVFDVNEAGKALAFELPTATGFHIFRATESVLRRYHTQVTSGQSPPKIRTIPYLCQINENGKKRRGKYYYLFGTDG
jgi:hypothetical protein